MNPALRSFSPAIPATSANQERDQPAERRTDIQWGSPIFRAPSLPTPQQLSNELPFTVNFRGKSPRRA
jgi:hypothetical protein